jgi:hypothetical protein
VFLFSVGLQVNLGANAILQLQRFQVQLKIETDSDRTEVNGVLTAEISESVAKNLHAEDVNEIMAKCKSPDQTVIENSVFRTRDTARRTGLRDVKPSSGGGKKTGEEYGQARVDGVKSGSKTSRSGNVHGEKKFIPSRDEGGWRRYKGHKKQGTDQTEVTWRTARGRNIPWRRDDCFQKDDDFYGKQPQREKRTFRPRNRGGIGGRWRDWKGTEGKDQMGTPKSETNETESQPTPVAPPPPTEEEYWD